MSELQSTKASRKKNVRHRDRITQIPIYLGKLLRSFIYQSDWKFLPMCAVIAALVTMVIRSTYFINMEGTLKGAFALTCVGIWNGGFNSIQSICRERNIIKREHRSGMHITSYVIAHMIYQALLCIAQSILTLYVCSKLGVQFPSKGFITDYFLVDLTITLFFITYASDMISLFVSSLAHSTTGAMTVMPFLLIFQLVLSGGVFILPVWAQPLSNFTISNYGLKCIAAQSDFNSKPLATAWDTLIKLESKEIDEVVTTDQLIEILDKKDNPAIESLRAIKLSELIRDDSELSVTLKELLQDDPSADITVGDMIELFKTSGISRSFHIQLTAGDLLDLAGRENVKYLVEKETAAASYKKEYELSFDNIIDNWLYLVGFIILFALLTVVSLEFIDKDKR